MDMTTEVATYNALVDIDVSNSDCAEIAKRVVPGEPMQSMLYLRVQPLADGGTADCGGKMPVGTEGLSPELAKLIYDWIKSGAKK